MDLFPANAIKEVVWIFPDPRHTLTPPQGDITRLLIELRDGRKEAEGQLIPLVYAELHAIAVRCMRREAPGHLLQPTALVNEAYLRLAQIEAIDWQGRAHFFAVAATLMRRVLVDQARARKAAKRGDGLVNISFNEQFLPAPMREAEVLALDEALNRLAQINARQAQTVEMRFFAGMSEEEIGEALSLSARTVKRDWRMARAWLHAELHG